MKYRELKENQLSEKEFENIRNTILDGTEEERLQLLSAIVDIQHPDFVDLISEVILFDKSPKVRALCFYYLSMLADEDKIDILLEAMQEEQNQITLDTMRDGFRIFISRHNLSIEKLEINLEDQHDQAEQQKEDVSESEEQRSELREDWDSQVEPSDYERVLQARRRVLETISNLEPDMPISLHRLAQMTGVTKSSLKRYLQELTEINPQAGKLLSYQDVFIKKPETVKTMLDRSTTRKVTCTNCGSSVTSYPCDQCGKGQQCITCRLMIGSEDDIITCPNCQGISHRPHLLEWVKIKRTCPKCKHELKFGQLQDS